ncbi:hypothetical protein OH492_16210 [Vibrio chagasii]|nr:hypothetical protein [Vibrio chagasii]
MPGGTWVFVSQGKMLLDRRVLEFIDLGSGLAMTEIVIGGCGKNNFVI